MKSTRKLTIYALLIAAALVLSYIESIIPTFFAVPGMKLGLTNIVIVVALYKMNRKSALLINFARVILATAMFGNMASFAYSIGGAMLSLTVMILVKRLGRFSIIAVSACGGIAHNLGQIIVAMILLSTYQVGYYMIVLWFTGIVSGLFIGIISGLIVERLPDVRVDS